MRHPFPVPFPAAWLLASLLAPAAVLSQPAVPTQSLPVRARVCGPVAEQEPQHQATASTCVDLEVPATPQEYAIGLMGRHRLVAERGMWFRFEQQDASIWMRHTLIPLDLVFLADDETPSMARIVKVAHDVQPCPGLPCPSTTAGQPVDHVVELASGEARRRHWTEGTLLDFSWLEEAGGENDR